MQPGVYGFNISSLLVPNVTSETTINDFDISLYLNDTI